MEEPMWTRSQTDTTKMQLMLTEQTEHVKGNKLRIVH